MTKFAKALCRTADGGAFWTLKTSIRSLGSPCVMVGEVGAEGECMDKFSTSITGDLLRGGEVGSNGTHTIERLRALGGFG